eukprot:8466190-Lingulodinium_polyedra.AAC.1
MLNIKPRGPVGCQTFGVPSMAVSSSSGSGDIRAAMVQHVAARAMNLLEAQEEARQKDRDLLSKIVNVTCASLGMNISN